MDVKFVVFYFSMMNLLSKFHVHVLLRSGLKWNKHLLVPLNDP